MDGRNLHTTADASFAATRAQTLTDVLASLETQTDEALRGVRGKVDALLETRALDRRKRAIAEIHRLARENGLTVDVGKPARKRGRPRKAGVTT